jgi:exonuclease III
MKIKIVKLICLLLLSSVTVTAQETFKLMFYNVLNFPIQGPSNRLQNLEVILNDYRPDLFMICELNNEQGADQILQTMQFINPNYKRAAFVLNSSDDNIGDSNELQNMLFFDSTKFILESQTEVITIYRDFNHYTLKLNTIDQNVDPVILDVFVCHLKSSDGTENQNLRLQMVQAFTTYLQSLPNNSNIVLAGDFNMYRSSEPGFQELIDNTNHIVLTDPPNRIGSWTNNTAFLDVFTQSTRTQSGLGGARGGFDDRFDFIMLSENMNSNLEIEYVPHSYQVYGNNNNINCYNAEINTSNCSGALFNSTIREVLYYMSDHLPVTLELQTNKSLSTQSIILNEMRFKMENISDSKIDLEFLSQDIKFIEIINVLGQIVDKQSIFQEKKVSIDISNYSKGVYYIVTNKRTNKPLKFIKN